MKKLVFFLFAATLWGVPQQITITSSTKASATIPTSSIYSSVATFRIEWRVTVPISATTSPNWNLYSQTQWATGTFAGYTARMYGQPYGSPPYTGGFSYLINSYQDVPATQLSCPLLSFNQDLVVRLQKWPTYLTCETWNVNGSNYQVTSTAASPFRNVPGLSGTLQIGDASSSQGTMAFFRAYSGNLPLGSKPPFGGTGGDIWDYEFNGNLNDSSGHGLTLSRTGTFTYSMAATYAPACILSPPTTVRAGTPVTTLTAASSFALDGGESITYVWQQIPSNLTGSPPSILQFSGRTIPNPTLQGLIAGTYNLQVTVTDSSGVSSTCSTKYGAVATDDNGVVIISNPIHAQMLGPLIASFASPWAAEPQQHIAHANLIIQKLAGTSPYDFFFVDYWNQAQAGTVSVSNGSNAVTGTGSTFTTTFCQGPGSPTIPKFANNTAIAVWYPILNPGGSFPSFPGTTGRRFGTVLSCTDDTHMTVSFTTSNGNWQTDAYVGAGSGLSYGFVNRQCGNITTDFGYAQNCAAVWEYTPAPADFYDNVKALYALWYRTGIDDYLIAARTLADRFWSHPLIDKGLNFETTNAGNRSSSLAAPLRALSLTGLFMRNADNPPYDYGPGLRAIVNYLVGTGTPNGSYIGPFETCLSVGPLPTNCGQDVREQGYGLKYVAEDALYNSGPTGASPNTAQVAIDQAALSRDMTNRWGQCQVINSTSDGLCRQWDTIGINIAGWRSSWGQGPGGYQVSINTASGVVTMNGSGGATFSAADFTAPISITSATSTNPMVLTFASAPGLAAFETVTISGAAGTGCAGMNGPKAITAGAGTSVTIAFDGTNCNYTGTSAKGALPNAIWFTSTGNTQPISNLQGDPGFFYVVYKDPTHLQLTQSDGVTIVPYTGNQAGSFIGWQTVNAGYASGTTGGVPSWLGFIWQPYMTGILNTAYWQVAQALATSDPTNAANAGTWAQNNAAVMATTGLDSTLQGGLVTDGAYYGVGIGCGSNLLPMYEAYSLSGGQCEYYIVSARELNGVSMGMPLTALQFNPSSRLFLTLGDTMMAAMFAQAGELGFDGLNILSDLASPGFAYSGASQHKFFGEFWGQGSDWSWAAARLGGLRPPILRVVQVSLNFQNATQAVLTVVRPDGTSSQVTCTSSPCPVTIDSRQGDHLLSIKYLNPVNQVLLPSVQTILKSK